MEDIKKLLLGMFVLSTIICVFVIAIKIFGDYFLIALFGIPMFLAFSYAIGHNILKRSDDE